MIPPSMLAASVGLLLAQSTTAAQFQNEPADFRGIAWGAPFDGYAQEMTLVRQDDNVRFYKRKGDKLAIGNAEAIKVAYRFYKDKFTAGVIQTYGPGNARALRDSLVDKYGEPEKLSKRLELYGWEGDNTRIVLTCEVTSYCAVEFVSKTAMALEEAETGQKLQVLKKNNDDDADGDNDGDGK